MMFFNISREFLSPLLETLAYLALAVKFVVFANRQIDRFINFCDRSIQYLKSPTWIWKRDYLRATGGKKVRWNLEVIEERIYKQDGIVTRSTRAERRAHRELQEKLRRKKCERMAQVTFAAIVQQENDEGREREHSRLFLLQQEEERRRQYETAYAESERPVDDESVYDVWNSFVLPSERRPVANGKLLKIMYMIYMFFYILYFLIYLFLVHYKNSHYFSFFQSNATQVMMQVNFVPPNALLWRWKLSQKQLIPLDHLRRMPFLWS